MSSIAVAAALAGTSAALLVGLPSTSRLRLAALSSHVRAGPARPCSSRVPVATSAAVALAAATLAVAGPVAACIAAAAAVAAVRWRAAQLQARAAAVERAAAVQGCAVLAAELSAGRTPAEALAAAAQVAVGPSRAALRAAAAAAGVGGDVASALASGASASAVGPVLRALAACWTVCAASGSGLAASVRRLEEGLRSDAARRRALEAELAGPRATAALLAVLPLVGLAMAAGLGADPLHVLLHTAAGVVCLALGLALDAVGVWWTGRLVALAGRAA